MRFFILDFRLCHLPGARARDFSIPYEAPNKGHAIRNHVHALSSNNGAPASSVWLRSSDLDEDSAGRSGTFDGRYVTSQTISRELAQRQGAGARRRPLASTTPAPARCARWPLPPPAAAPRWSARPHPSAPAASPASIGSLHPQHLSPASRQSGVFFCEAHGAEGALPP